MSYDYVYYLGYINKDTNKIYPLGPYDMHGKLHEVFYRSRSFASSLHRKFKDVQTEQITEPLKKDFEYKEYGSEAKKMPRIKYLETELLPRGEYIKRGYYLLDEVEAYLRETKEEPIIDPGYFFSESIPMELYGERLKTEIALGSPKPARDCEGEEIEVHSVADFTLFAFPDYSSEEYEAQLLRNAAESYEYSVKELRENNTEIVVLETDG